MLLRLVAIVSLAGLLFLVVWYFWFIRSNRRRAEEILHWVNRAFDGHGEAATVQWIGASRFFISMHAPPSLFIRTSLMVKLRPRENPIAWFLSRIRHEQECLTFQADLDSAPCFNLEVHNHTWYGRTRRRFPGRSQNWVMEQAGPYVLTTRNDWQRDITTMMNALLASRECECLSVCFRRSSPHLSVTVPVAALSPDEQVQLGIFDVLRELATGALAVRF